MSKFTEEDANLLKELGVDVTQDKPTTFTAREERIIAGFEDIQRFVEEYGRLPQHGEEKDIFERLYATRLDRIRQLEECRLLVEPLDHQGLLGQGEAKCVGEFDDMDDDALLEELGVEAESDDITKLRFVRSSAERKAAEMIASRTPCKDFNDFKPLFEKVQSEIQSKVRVSDYIRKGSGFLKLSVEQGNFFVLGGQMLYVAEVGELFKAPNGENDARLRVIYSNGTESNILLRSLQRRLYDDKTSRRISDTNLGSLFSDALEDADIQSGTVYVLRSDSDHPFVKEHREAVHKIGVTSSKVSRRIAQAHQDPTYMLAAVEVVAEYRLYNINRSKFEHLIHSIFEQARLDIILKDRFNKPYKPKEWFFVPLPAINDVMEKIKDGTIADYVYDKEQAALVQR